MSGGLGSRTKIEEAFLYVAPVHASVVRDARAALDELEARCVRVEEALRAIIEAEYGTRSKGDYASFIRDLAHSGLAADREEA